MLSVDTLQLRAIVVDVLARSVKTGAVGAWLSKTIVLLASEKLFEAS